MVTRTSPEVYRRVRASPKRGKTPESPDVARMRREWAERKWKGKGTKGKYVRVRGMKEKRKEQGGRERDRGNRRK